MLEWKVLNLLPTSKFCKGSIVAARIYADVKGNTCQCGGRFSKRVPHPDDALIIVPKCGNCNQYPPLFVLDIDGFDINGAPKSFRVRNDQNNSRLDKISKVVFTLEKIQQEIIEGSFDSRKYESESSKRSYIFEVYYNDEYLPKYLGDVEYQDWYAERVKESKLKMTVLDLSNPVGRPPKYKMSPKGLREKIGFIRRELLPHFGKMDISKINEAKIKEFKESYQTKYKVVKGVKTLKTRTRDLALGELKAILNEARADGKIIVVPEFEKIPRAKLRTNIIQHSGVKDTTKRMNSQLHKDLYEILGSYIMRQCEIGPLSWAKVNMEKEEFTIDCHFSDGIIIAGRKSVSEGEASVLTFKMTPKVKEIFQRRHPLNQSIVPIGWENNLVFLTSIGTPVTPDYLWDAWDQGRRKSGHKHAPYECKHAVTTEFSKKFNGNVFKLKKAGGWTNVTTVERYNHEAPEMNGLE